MTSYSPARISRRYKATGSQTITLPSGRSKFFPTAAFIHWSILLRNPPRWIERETLPHYPKANICLMRPSVALIVMRGRDVDSIRSAIPNLDHVTHIFMPLNDNREVGVAEGGTHWSLLLVSAIDGIAFHYDSMGRTNYNEGYLATQKMSQLLGRRIRFLHLSDTPQQTNTNDCGVFVCLIMRHLLVKRLLNATSKEKVKMSMGDKVLDAQGMRKEMLRVIETLRKEAERRRS